MICWQSMEKNSYYGNVYGVQHMINYGAEDLSRAALYALTSNHINIIEILTKNNFDIYNQKKYSLLEAATLDHNIDAIHTLFAYDKNYPLRDALSYAAMHGYNDILQYFYDQDRDIYRRKSPQTKVQIDQVKRLT